MDKYVLKANFVVEESIENLELQQTLDDQFEAITNNMQKSGVKIKHVSSNYIEISEIDNCGNCCICGAWVSDFMKEPHIEELSNGAVIKGRWYCDICLPKDHPNHF